MKASLFSFAAMVITLNVVGCGPAEPGEDVGSGPELGQSKAGLQSGQSVAIRPSHSGKCLDVKDASQADWAQVQQWDCWGGASQTFVATWHSDYDAWSFKAAHSGKCLSVAGGASATPLAQATCTYGNYQMFRVQGTGPFRLQSVYSGKYVDISGYSVDNGALAHMWDPNYLMNQSFSIF